ncbi:hypothetical protein GCM10010363_24150 [Streptomyces omiyaensis]|nr:hypothetical protein GCM10010363_24150 [Streptomyces omiyaensis]
MWPGPKGADAGREAALLMRPTLRSHPYGPVRVPVTAWRVPDAPGPLPAGACLPARRDPAGGRGGPEAGPGRGRVAERPAPLPGDGPFQ